MVVTDEQVARRRASTSSTVPREGEIMAIDHLNGVNEDEEMVMTPSFARRQSTGSFINKDGAERSFGRGGTSPPSSSVLRRGSMQNDAASARMRGTSILGEANSGSTPSRRRGSLQVEDMPSFSRKREGRGDADSTAASDAAMASSLKEASNAIDEKIGDALDKIGELQDAAMEGLPDGSIEDKFHELEVGVHETFDVMVRNVQSIVKVMSEKDAEVHREHSKAAAKQFATKLEHSRTAANVSLKNKSMELSANFQKQLMQQIAELKDGGGSLLLEAQAAAEEAQRELADERMKHDGCKEALQHAQQRLEKLEAFTSSWAEDRQSLEQQNRSLQKEVEEGRAGLTDALDELKTRVEDMTNENSTLSGTLEKTLADLGIANHENLSLAEQISQLVSLHEALKVELESTGDKLAQERNRSQQSLRVAAAEAERAAIAHEADMKRLTQELSVKMKKTVAILDSGGQLDEHDQQMQNLFAELLQLQKENEELKTASDDSGASFRKDIKVLTADLRDAKTKLAENKSQLDAQTSELAQKAAKLVELTEQTKGQEEELKMLRIAARGKGNLKALSEEIEGLKKQVSKYSNETGRLEAEKAEIKDAIAKALQDLGTTRKKNQTLAEQIAELIKSAADSKKGKETMAVAVDEIKTELRLSKDKAMAKQKDLEVQLSEANARIADGERWHIKATDLQEEMERIRASLQDALSSVQLIKNDKRQLSEQIREIVTRYRTAEQALEHTSKELIVVTEALQHSTVELSRRTDAAKREREALVRAALASMQQLRSHLTFTLAGLRIHQARGEHAAMPWKRSAGVITPGGDPMLVQFVPPLHKSLGSTRQPDYLHAQQESAGLPPVQIQPPTPVAPAAGEVWLSDTPLDPMLPTNRRRRPTEGHRWGVVARPPQHTKSSRATSARGSPRAAPASARAAAQAAKWTMGENVPPRPRTALNVGSKTVTPLEPVDTDAILQRWETPDHGRPGSSRGDSFANLRQASNDRGGLD